MATHDPEEVEPQRLQSGILQSVQLSGHLVGKTSAVVKNYELELIKGCDLKLTRRFKNYF